MNEIIQSSYMAHGYCLSWRPWLVGLHAGADLLIAMSYFAIPIAIWIFLRNRKDLELRGLAWMFAGFILFCGITHVVGLITLWTPIYETEGLIKAGTAGISVFTALAIFPLIPKALAIPSPKALRTVNEQLADEIKAHKSTLEDLEAARADLEQRVEQRTRELRESEARFRATFENAAVGIAHVAPDGTWLLVNERLCQIIGYSPDELVSKTFQDITHPDDLGADVAHLEQLLAGEIDRYDAEKRYLTKDGEVVWINLTVSCVRKADGAVDYFISIIEDISERKQAEEQLRRSRDTFFNLIQNAPFGVYLVDSEFCLGQVSAGARKVFSTVYPHIGRDFAEVLNILWPQPFADEAIARFRHTLATGEPFHATDTTERRGDIDEIEAYDWQIERVTLPDGRFGVVCYFYELTELKRQQERIRLLMGEVNHRAKNLLGVVQSIARQTAKDADPKTFTQRLTERLQGLSASQDLIISGNWQAVTFEDLVSSQLQHLGESVRRRIRIEGGQTMIKPAAAQGIGMALHELATNAMKYGALSNEEGHVVIAWSNRSNGGEKRFFITWHEEGGPPVAEPVRSGFGRTVIERMAAHSVGGIVEIGFDPAGLHWKLDAPEEEVVFSGVLKRPASGL